MALENMHAMLYDTLKESGTVETVIAEWEEEWQEAQRHPGKPLPCPHCFIRDEIGRLKALSNVGNTARAQCERCLTEFRWPDAKG